MLGTILLVILVLVLVGGIAPFGPYPTGGHFYGTGYAGAGGIGLVLVILLILLLVGRI